MIGKEQIESLINGGGNVVGTDGGKIGSVGQIYVDDVTGEPSWVTAKTGLFGSAESFVPLDQAEAAGSDISVPYSKDKVKDAPRVEQDGHMSPEEEDGLYSYYGLGGTSSAGMETGNQGVDGRTDYTGTAGTEGRDTSGPTTDDAMTRSEEQLRVGTQKQEVGRARLRKYVVTENVTQTVPVSHEEVRVEREPITDANRGDALDGPAISEEEHEVTLHAERPVVEKEAVPVERVRLGTETVAGEETVSEEVRKEQIDTDGTDGVDDTTDGRTRP